MFWVARAATSWHLCSDKDALNTYPVTVWSGVAYLMVADKFHVTAAAGQALAGMNHAKKHGTRSGKAIGSAYCALHLPGPSRFKGFWRD
jgi:hypothetical protein